MIAKYVTKYFLLLNIDFVPYYACVYKIHKYKQSFQYGTRVVRSSVAYFVFNSLLGHYFVTPSNPMQAFWLSIADYYIFPPSIFCSWATTLLS